MRSGGSSIRAPDSRGGVLVLESLVLDARYALRGIRRAPLFSASVTATIGLGLGILCSAFTTGSPWLISKP
jgi:hypothetical protein